MYPSLQDFGDNRQYGNRAIVSCITFISTFMNRFEQRVFPLFWVMLASYRLNMWVKDFVIYLEAI